MQNKQGLMPKQELKEASKKAKKARYDLAAQPSIAQLQAKLEASNVQRANSAPSGTPAPTKGASAKPSGGKNGLSHSGVANGKKRPAPSPDALLPSVEQSLSFGVLKAKTNALKAPTAVEVAGVPVVVEPTAAAVAKPNKRKVSLKELLAQAEKNQSRLNALKEQFVETETGKTAPDELWDAPLKRAAGEKVKDNPALIRKTMRKEKQKKQRSAQKWCVRASTGVLSFNAS